MDITIGARSELTGRFNFVWTEDNDVSFDDTEAHEVVTSVIEKRRSYWADRNHGSDLRTLRSLTTRTPSQAEQTALAALDTAIQARRIVRVVAAAAAQRARGRLRLDLRWSTPGGSNPSVALEV